jgi:hypothetical protein
MKICYIVYDPKYSNSTMSHQSATVLFNLLYKTIRLLFDGRTKLILSILNRENPSIAAFNIINNYLLFNTKQCVLSIILTIIIHNIKNI